MIKVQRYIEIVKEKLFNTLKTIIDNNGNIIQVINVDDKYLIIYSY